ncbi:MAG TPA: 3-phosphoserine/phosphohydroxythreonine transaminase, partial [Gammaproteobacteria bacterium]|nr:3-phosphoserine/phosphohydroxythreonine transaminase [Gammaproteobacteria bacterium]
MTRVYNFSAGPAMLPTAVMEKAQRELLDYDGMGASVIEISHRSKEFDAIINASDALLVELANIPQNYKILYVHGGAQMQFSAVPMNLINRLAQRKAAYVETGNFAKLAHKEAARYGDITVVANSEASNYDCIPALDTAALDPQSSYAYITSN